MPVPRLVTLVAAATVAAACAAPRDDRRPSPIDGMQRVLAIDLSPRALTRRGDRLARVGPALRAELACGDVADDGAALVAGEVRRTGDAVDAAGDLAGAELERRPNVAATARVVLPPPHELGQDVADVLGKLLAMLGLERRPLGEIDDRMHRTDPSDRRPEATWWQRLRRRLWL
jgi:hypothetical protein